MRPLRPTAESGWLSTWTQFLKSKCGLVQHPYQKREATSSTIFGRPAGAWFRRLAVQCGRRGQQFVLVAIWHDELKDLTMARRGAAVVEHPIVPGRWKPKPIEFFLMNAKLCWLHILVVVVGGPAAVPQQTLIAAENDFQELFDGKTLDGWKAVDMTYWSVEDGAITGKITQTHPLQENLYLIWQGGELADFELKLKSRVFGSRDINNGFQFRSRELPNHDVAGYQVDNNLNTDWLVRLYDEHGRHDLALRGQHTVFDELGKAQITKILEAKGAPWFKLEEWHVYHLICEGPHLTLKVNGRLAAEVIDNDLRQRDLSGILALQLHTGPPTTVQFKDIQLKVLGSTNDRQ
jgi:hypothetical protein